MLKYATFQYFIETNFPNVCTPVILEHIWRLPFHARIICTITWIMAFLSWTKPGNITWNFMAKENWELR